MLNIDRNYFQNNLNHNYFFFQTEAALPPGEAVSFKLVFNKTKYDIEFPLDGTIKQLKEHLSSIISEY